MLNGFIKEIWFSLQLGSQTDVIFRSESCLFAHWISENLNTNFLQQLPQSHIRMNNISFQHFSSNFSCIPIVFSRIQIWDFIDFIVFRITTELYQSVILGRFCIYYFQNMLFCTISWLEIPDEKRTKTLKDGSLVIASEWSLPGSFFHVHGANTYVIRSHLSLEACHYTEGATCSITVDNIS